MYWECLINSKIYYNEVCNKFAINANLSRIPVSQVESRLCAWGSASLFHSRGSEGLSREAQNLNVGGAACPNTQTR